MHEKLKHGHLKSDRPWQVRGTWPKSYVASYPDTEIHDLPHIATRGGEARPKAGPFTGRIMGWWARSADRGAKQNQQIIASSSL